VGNRIEVSPSGRAKCRACKETVAKGDVRFAETYDSAFSDGEAFRYWHLPCAAKKIPALVKPALAAYGDPIANRAEVEKTIDDALKKGKGSAAAPLPHADLAPNGRAKCLVCGETLEKGKVRVAVEREVDTPMGPRTGAGYLHPGCAPGWAEEQGEDTEAFGERVLAHSGHLPEAELAVLRELFAAEEA
jgi:hypothetical protein